MLAHVALTLRRLSRLPIGQAALLGALLVPAILLGLPLVISRWDADGGQSFRLSFSAERLSLLLRSILLVVSFSVANLIAWAVDDERRSHRARLLRVQGFDGARAVLSFLALAVTLTALLAALAGAGSFAATLLVDARPLPVLGAVLLTTAALGIAAPLWIAAAYLLPRPVALAAVNFGALSVTVLLWTVFSAAPVPDPGAWLLSLGLAGLVTLLLSAVWRATAERLWS